MEREKQAIQLPYGISPIVRNFLLDCIRYDAISTLDEPVRKIKNFIPARQRNLIGTYYGSDATTYELAKIHNLSRNRVIQLVKEGMLKMWKVLPDNVKENYSRKEILKMKAGHSPRTREKFSKATKGRPSPFRGIKASPEKIAKNRQRSFQLWQDPVYREKTLKGQEDYRRRKFNKVSKKKEAKKTPAKKINTIKEKPTIKKLPPKTENLTGEISVSETSLQNLVKSYIDKEVKKKKSVTVDEVCGHLQFLGIIFEPQQIIRIFDR